MPRRMRCAGSNSIPKRVSAISAKSFRQPAGVTAIKAFCGPGQVTRARTQRPALGGFWIELVAKQRDRGDMEAAVPRRFDCGSDLIRRLDVAADIEFDGVEPGFPGEVDDLLE